jgi:F-type H+-transporting ATPase subunit b
MRKLTLKSALLMLMLVLLLATPLLTLAQDATEEPHSEDTTAEAGGDHSEGTTSEEAAPSPLEPLGINAGFLIAQIVNFSIVLGGLTLLLWRPAMTFLDKRAAEIQKGLEDAAAAAKARQNAEQEAEKVLAEARAEASKLIAEARNRGEDVAKAIQTEARSKAEEVGAQARVDAQAARDAELAGLRDQVVNISVAMAQRIIGESLDAKKQQSLVTDFFSKVPADAKSLAGKVEVVSAMPLNPDEQNKVKSELGASDVAFSVDPAILGGLIIRSQDKVVDGSVRSNLNNLAARLN